MFAMIYIIVLTFFAYYHFLASNDLHAGLLEQGLDSLWWIFIAMVGEFEQRNKQHCQYTLTQIIVMGITLTNYFLINVLLVNLFVAFLTNTIEEIDYAAKTEWRLQRARIMLDADLGMARPHNSKSSKLLSHLGKTTKCLIPQEPSSILGESSTVESPKRSVSC